MFVHAPQFTLTRQLNLVGVLVNGAGSSASVIKATGLTSLSFSAIVNQLGQLPATSQAALVMAFLSAFIIPIGALVAGDGLAALAVERRTGVNHQKARWQEVEFTVVYRAVFVRYMQAGLAEREARQRATAEVKGYLGSSAARLLSASTGQSGQSANGRGETVKGMVRTHLDAHPDLEQLSVN